MTNQPDRWRPDDVRRLLTPRWLVGHVFVAAVGVTCVILGFWQLDRLEERRVTNLVHAARFEEPPQSIDRLLQLAGDDIDSLEFRRATATGEYHPAEEVLIRSRVRDGIAGFGVITPLVDTDGSAVAVDRGWVPLEFDTVPVSAAPPPDGTITVTGVIRLSEQRGALGRDDSTAEEDASFSRIDLDLLDTMVTAELEPVYLQELREGSPIDLPATAPPPDFDDEGPHLSYAIQWFSFAVVGAIGYGFLLRRAIRGASGGGDSEVVDDFDAGEHRQIGT